MEVKKYRKTNLPIELTERCDRLKHILGCRTLISFISIGMTDFMNRLENENKKDTNK